MAGRSKRASLAAIAEVRAERDERWERELAIDGERRHFILEGREAIAAPLMEWAYWFERGRNRILKQECVRGRFVSTVFLGIDHQFGAGPPLLFETMVFDGDGIGEGLATWRWATYEEAESGHAYAVALTEAGASYDSKEA